MVASPPRSSRYQREQRITAISWTVVVIVAALCAAFHSRWEGDSAPPDEASPSVEPPVSMHVWLNQSQLSITRLVSARNDVAAAASRRNIPATGTACQAALDAVATVRDHMPSPEAAVNQPLQQAISSYTTGLPFCVTASGNVDGAGMQLAARLIRDGDLSMQLALAVIGDDSDSSPVGVLIV